MSKTGSFIIRHEFVQAWTDKGAARTFVFKTIERLKEYFHLQEPDEYFKYEEDDYGLNSTHKCNLSVRPFVMVAKLAKKYSRGVRKPSFFLGLLFNLF